MRARREERNLQQWSEWGGWESKQINKQASKYIRQKGGEMKFSM